MATASKILNGSHQLAKYQSLYVELELVSQDIPNNKSTLRYRVYLKANTSGYSGNTNGIGTYTISSAASATGNKQTWSWTYSSIAIVKDWTTFSVAHAADGTLANQSITADVYVGPSLGKAVVTVSLAVPTIPRESTPTLTYSSREYGQSVTINTNRKAATFTHVIKATWNGVTETIATGVTTSFAWTIPTSYMSRIPNSTSTTGTITLETYSGTTLVGKKTITLATTVPSSVVPTINSVSITDANTTSWQRTGAFIEDSSQFKIVVSASGASGSTIKSYQTQANGQTFATATATTSVITTPGNKTITVTVTDSRGRTAKWTGTQTVLGASTPTVNYSTRNFGAQVVIETNKKATGITHKIVAVFGGVSNTLASAAADSLTWTIPNDWMTRIPRATSLSGELQITTLNGTTPVGDVVKIPMTLVVPSTVISTISSKSVTDANTSSWGQIGAFVQSKSKFSCSMSATGAYGATITAYEIVANNQTFKAASGTTGTVMSSGMHDIRFKITDSRGRSRSELLQVNVLPYAVPKILAFSAQRCNADGTLNQNGLYAKVAYRSSVTALGNKNTQNHRFRYRRVGTTTWTTVALTPVAYATNSSSVVSGMSSEFSYEFEFLVSDFYSTTTATARIATAYVTMDFRSGGRGVAFGKVSEKNAMEINMPVEFYHSAGNFTDTDIRDALTNVSLLGNMRPVVSGFGQGEVINTTLFDTAIYLLFIGRDQGLYSINTFSGLVTIAPILTQVGMASVTTSGGLNLTVDLLARSRPYSLVRIS